MTTPRAKQPGAILLPDSSSIEGLFEHDVIAEVDRVESVPAPRFPEEWNHVARAVPKRQAEFLTARECARRALERLGYPPAPLLPRTDRSPIWPEGVTGSITHAGTCCAVVVAQSPPLRSIGLDIEMGDELARELERQICTQREHVFLDASVSPRWTRGLLAKILFNTKETVYKCQYPISGIMLDFHDVEMHLDLEHNEFDAEILVPKAVQRLGTSTVNGRFAVRGGLVLSGCEID